MFGLLPIQVVPSVLALSHARRMCHYAVIDVLKPLPHQQHT